MASSGEFKHHVVQLDSHIELPPLRFPHTFEKHVSTTPSELPSRIASATIAIATTTSFTKANMVSAPQLQLISCLGAGCDKFDLHAAKEAGVTVTNTPAQNTSTVAEHALSLYFAVKRKIVELNAFTKEGEKWKKQGMSVLEFRGVQPRVCEEEAVGIIGYGALGQRVEKMCKALDMNVLIAERKGEATTRPGRAAFEEILRKSTTLFLTCPLDPSTRDMVSHHELSLLSPSSILINVGRGGIVNENALATALKEGKLLGAGLDVFEHEPATKENCPLLADDVPGLVATPHLAWFSGRTVEGTKTCVRDTIEAFARGDPINVVVDGREAGK
ncbi:hypothetical protein AUEXF2481DRAFT_221772 [Aureobasidium subglaciale EXF-2481]|uniref:D-isomer specific 2-hydroxyacid dehydrogenase NAD-binding domain-containing protein n=1 Tax=Aureobasidium subglaciale (strain EXF-2481) TaxID=1043005 RepID=A0A074YN23_AURSE|nr:uncharacterized protein AUEXF2481DRAFT_221772 [Aureobasidium subglaciale EXF-2481]KAI5209197.1 hypothetical protein E4T38_02590 [Aureobasidium subglaciale]KAI5228096.1 hypothetical protein E4T40_02369 [Aureobasidium subglaciale]KAI5231524.1 hypothetical protein E4T41_02589 [Aureobasidium subglaciale]KAI5265404.1 hypothetical protein E4T46_02367 [Aureobasidium subglaciale]KEQ95507.1 hypothetical protein AUEXF2481DRAFT_221772 [Aureobasidium subglaciale EXF-2481]